MRNRVPILVLSWLLFLHPAFLTAKQGEDRLVVRFLFAFTVKSPDGPALSRPQALAIDPEGILFVLDTGNNRILKLDLEGTLLTTVGGFGWEKEAFDRPVDITAGTGLDVFVADFNNQRIERYDKNLNYLSSFYSDENLTPDLRFAFPVGLDISSQGELFICDEEHNRVLKLDVKGKPLLSFGDYNWGSGQLQQPVRVTLGPDNLVFVTDRSAGQIVVFDYYGNYVARFGSGELNEPAGLSWSDRDFLFVADAGSHRVVVFDPDYQLAGAWGSEGSKNAAFKSPQDVAALNERVYVLDSGNDRIQVFELLRKP